jgi:hypothetical protein
MDIDCGHTGFEGRVRRIYRSTMAEWLCSHNYNLGLTLNFNAPVGLALARKQVGDLFFRADRRLLGSRFHRKRDRRITGVFFFEHVQTNLHCHGLIKVEPDRLDGFKALFDKPFGDIWSRVCVSGTHYLSDLTSPRAAAYYDLKEQRPWSDPQTTLWLEEFFPE